MQPYYFPPVVGPPSSYTSTVTNYTDITGLTINLAPGALYIVQAWVTFAVTSTTTTVKFGLGYTGTDVAPTAYAVVIRSGSGDGTTNRASPVIPDTGTVAGPITAAGTYCAIINGLVATSPSAAGGTLSVQTAHVATPAITIATNGGLMLVQQIG